MSILACEGCFLLRTSASATSWKVAAVGAFVVAALLALGLLVVALRRRPGQRTGPLLLALGVAVLPVAVVPMVNEVVTGTSTARSTFTVYCDKPVMAGQNPALVPTASTDGVHRAAQQACQAGFADRRRQSALLAGAGLVAVAGGVEVMRRRRTARPSPGGLAVPAAG